MTALTRQMDFSDTQLIVKGLFHAVCNILAHFFTEERMGEGICLKFFVLQNCLTSGAI